MKRFALLLPTLLAACSSVAERELEIRAINIDEQSVRCLVVVDRQWPLANNDPIYTDGVVSLTFSGDRLVNVRVKPVQTRMDGRPAKVPEPNDASPYISADRDLTNTDPSVQLFILRRNPEYLGQ